MTALRCSGSFLLILSVAVCLPCVGRSPGNLGPDAAWATARPESATLATPRDYDRNTRVDANRIDMWVTNHGSIAYDIEGANSGLIYPRRAYTTAMFAAGLWMGARVEDEVRIAVAEYSWEFGPGPALATGGWADPTDPRYRVYKIRPGDTPQSNPDYAEWPASDGAPLDAAGAPLIRGTQTLWSVFNDLDPSRHNNGGGSTNPLGVEVQHMTFASEMPDPARYLVFLEWKVIHRGTHALEDAYVAIWADPDLGGATDDLIGCDPDQDHGYCYNANNADTQYGSSPPAVGIQLIHGPLVPSPGDVGYQGEVVVPHHRNLGMTSFTRYINGTDPDNHLQTYNYMQGLNADGSPVIDPTTGTPTLFPVSGDPVVGTGWLDTHPSDKRFMISSGPFDMEPGDTQVIVAAILVGDGPNRLASVSHLQSLARIAPDLYPDFVADDPGACCYGHGRCVLTTLAACGGTFLPDQTCAPNPCPGPAGACCLVDGRCTITSSTACDGAYQGDGVACTPDLCPVPGAESACCLSDGTCELRNELACQALGGVYVADTTCDVPLPQNPVGWRRTGDGALMMDEVAGAEGATIPPDGRGGPGHSLWHRPNTTGAWTLSAGGGDGNEGRFTRNGADIENLTYENLELRWDHHPSNLGWWVFDDGTVAPVPFGLFAVHPQTAMERRLIPVLFASNGTVGVFDASPDTPDGYFGWPATDWIYAYGGDYAAFAADAADGTIDNDPTTVEYFARLVVASPSGTFPEPGTVIRFSTSNSGRHAGDGFARVVPFAWPPPVPGFSGCASPLYDVYRNGVLIGSTQRHDFLDAGGLVAGLPYTYDVRTRDPNPEGGDLPSALVTATPGSDTHSFLATWTPTPPEIDGMVGDDEWGTAPILDASAQQDGPASQLRVLYDANHLYLAVKDGLSAEEMRIHVDGNGNGIYDGPLEGRIVVTPEGIRFDHMSGSYPDAALVRSIADPAWTEARRVGRDFEMRLDRHRGPLASPPGASAPGVWVYSAEGSARYPVGPASIIELAPALFARLDLAPATPLWPSGRGDGVRENAALETATTRCFPNPVVDQATLAYRVPSDEGVQVEIFDVRGRRVRSLVPMQPHPAGIHVVQWDGRDQDRHPVASGVYYYVVRGSSFTHTAHLQVLR